MAEPGAAHGHRGAALFKKVKLIGPVPVSLALDALRANMGQPP
jgi:hypothetical protein